MGKKVHASLFSGFGAADLADENAMLEFAVIGLKYDVLGLSFLGRMKG